MSDFPETMRVMREIKRYIDAERGEVPAVWVVTQSRWDKIAAEHEGGFGWLDIRIRGVPLVVVP